LLLDALISKLYIRFLCRI